MEFNQPQQSMAAELGVMEPGEVLAKRELRFHYSQQFYAEARGEEVIEDILLQTYSKKQRIILNAQLKDELEHLRLYRAIIERQGLEPGASRYAGEFCQLVKDQKSLAEKVFVFQILAESVSAGYCQWRLNSIRDSQGSAADQVVAADELRHLGMGHCFLSLCDPDELQSSLPKARKTELLKDMNRICRQSVTESLVETLGIQEQVAAERFGRTSLDRLMTSMILGEVRKSGATMSFEDIAAFYNPLQPAAKERA